MGKLLGVVLIIFALISLIAFTALDPDNNDDDFEDNRFLEPKGNPGSTTEHEFYANRGNEIRLTFTSDSAPIRVTLKNRDNGNQNETVLAEESDSGDYEHYFDNDGNYVLRFENNQDRGTNIHFSTHMRNNDNDAPRAICGLFMVIFFLLGIIFLIKKGGKKGPSIIHARGMLHPQFPSHQQSGSGTQKDLTPRSTFAPPSSDPRQSNTDSGHDLSSPSGQAGAPEADRGIASSTANRSAPPGHGLGYHKSKKPTPAFPMPKDTSKHESHFRCPDCGTVIFINRKIKKVKCPKCSHTFKMERPN